MDEFRQPLRHAANAVGPARLLHAGQRGQSFDAMEKVIVGNATNN